MDLPGEIGFVTIWTLDLEAERSFFETILGCAVQHSSDDAVVIGGPQSQIVIQLAQGKTLGLAGSCQVGYFVRDLAAWRAHLLGEGADVLAADTDLGDGSTMLVVRTPSGQGLALVEHG